MKRSTSLDKVEGFLTGRYQYDKPAKGFVFDNSKLCFTTKENFEGEDKPELWKSDTKITY